MQTSLTKILVISLFIFSHISIGFAQEWNSARITTLYGSNIPFNFSSVGKLKDGIEIKPGTEIGISMADSTQTGHYLKGFKLNFKVFNLQTELKGDKFTLELNKIRVKAENLKGLESGYSEGYQALSSGWTLLFTYEPVTWSNLNWYDHQLTISYDCGIPGSDGGILLGEKPDYYNVEIEFELEPIF